MANIGKHLILVILFVLVSLPGGVRGADDLRWVETAVCTKGTQVYPGICGQAGGWLKIDQITDSADLIEDECRFSCFVAPLEQLGPVGNQCDVDDQRATAAGAGGCDFDEKPEAASLTEGADEEEDSSTDSTVKKGDAEKLKGTVKKDPDKDDESDSKGDSYAGSACGEAERAYAECEQLSAEAQKCCGSPMSCMGAEGALGEGGTSAVTGLLSAVGMLAMSGGSLSQQCAMGKNLNLGSAGMNGATAYICNNKKGVCEQSCAQAATALADCGADSVETRKAKMKVNACVALSAKAGAMTQQALQGLMSAQMASLCEKEADTQSYGFDDFNPDDVFNNDCSDPANASNPLCQDVCNQPGAENNPLCHANSADTSIADNNTGTSDYGEAGGGDGGYGADLGDGGPAIGGFNPGAAGGSSAKVVPNNSGGGIPGGGGGGSFGGGGGGNKAAANRGRGYNTDILRGTTKGGGYSSSLSNGGGSGGFKGYGRGKGKGGGYAGKKGSTFDLKKYLPGYGKGKNKRGIVMGGNRSIANLKKGIGSKFGDVFKTVSTRYQLLCLKRQMKDCR